MTTPTHGSESTLVICSGSDLPVSVNNNTNRHVVNAVKQAAIKLKVGSGHLQLTLVKIISKDPS